MQITIDFHDEAEKKLFITQKETVLHMVNLVVEEWIELVKNGHQGELTNWMKFSELDYDKLLDKTKTSAPDSQG